MGTTIWQVDAFTPEPFKGNPAGVCLLSEPATEAWMMSVAAEINASETAFLHPQGPGFSLRWFAPTTEVDLCGHGTLAAAHVLFSQNVLAGDQTVRFFTKSGELTARTLPQGWIELDFPANPTQEAPAPPELAAALGVTPQFVGRDRFDYLVLVDDAALVRALAPDMSLLKKVDTRGVMVTAPGDEPGLDFLSRFFCPRLGMDEDPVTGSAHCVLGPFWRERLGKDQMLAYQASRRGGYVKVAVRGERVALAGQACSVLRCELLD